MKEDVRAIRRLIKRYTKKRDWTMVWALFFDLGTLLEEVEREAGKAAIKEATS